MGKGFPSKNSDRVTSRPEDSNLWGSYRYTSNPSATTYSKTSATSDSKYERTNLQTGRHPGKKKKMSDDYNFGHYGTPKKKSSSSRYPWLGGKSKKLSW